jgi:hypothetical protein
VAVAGATGALAAGTAALAATGIGAAVALVALLATFIGKGCGQACIESSQAEQIYEVAAEDLWAVAKLGMLSQSDFTQAIQILLQGGTQHMQSLEASDPKAKAGLANMTKAIQAEGNASLLPATATHPIDLTQAQAVFIAPNTPGWYPGSIAAGNQAALTYLQNLQTQKASQTSVVAVSPSTGTVAILGQSFSMTEVVIGLALVAGLIYFAK